MDLLSNMALSAASGFPVATQRRRWSKEEDQYLANQVRNYLDQKISVDWRRVASGLENRSNKDCRKRWLKIDTKWHQGPWSKSEDERLKKGYAQFHCRWKAVSDIVETRNPDQCAKRWRNALDPNLERGEWNREQDAKLLLAVSNLGRNWKDIEKEYFPGRSRLDLSNRYTMLDRRRRPQNRRPAKRSATSTPDLSSCSSVSGRSIISVSPTPEHTDMILHSQDPHSWDDKSFNAFGLHTMHPGTPQILPSELPSNNPYPHLHFQEPAIKVEDWSLPSNTLPSSSCQPMILSEHPSSVCSTPYIPWQGEWNEPKVPMPLMDAPHMFASYHNTPLLGSHSPPLEVLSRPDTPSLQDGSPNRRTITLDNVDMPTRAAILDALCKGNSRVSLVID